MSPDKLVHMANQIASYFATQDPDEAAAGVAGHINDFWEPRMRRELFAIMDVEGARGLDPLVLAARPMIRKVPAPVADAAR